jgi:hypothetical protein
MLVVRRVGGVELAGSMASQKRTERLIEQSGIRHAGPELTRAREQTLVNRRAHPCACHATSMPRMWHAMLASVSATTRHARPEDERALRTIDHLTWSPRSSPGPAPPPERPFFRPGVDPPDVLAAEARSRQARKLTLRVLSANAAARALYAAAGFTVEGLLKEHFRLEDAYVDDVIMALDLT